MVCLTHVAQSTKKMWNKFFETILQGDLLFTKRQTVPQHTEICNSYFKGTFFGSV